MYVVNQNKYINKVSEKKKKRLQSTWWEKLVFKQIWEERNHICKVCWSRIWEPLTFCFAHILSKLMYPRCRMIKENIVLVCSIDCHHELDKKYPLAKKREFFLELSEKYPDLLDKVTYE